MPLNWTASNPISKYGSATLNLKSDRKHSPVQEPSYRKQESECKTMMKCGWLPFDSKSKLKISRFLKICYLKHSKGAQPLADFGLCKSN